MRFMVDSFNVVPNFWLMQERMRRRMLLLSRIAATHAHTWQYPDRLSPYHKAHFKTSDVGRRIVSQASEREDNEARENSRVSCCVCRWSSGYPDLCLCEPCHCR